MALTPQQAETRKSGLFSSDIGMLMLGKGVVIALQKLGHIPEFNLDDVAEIKIGKKVEPLILDAYEKQTGCVLERDVDTIMHPTIPWMGCHIDSRCPEKKVVEAKTCGIYNKSEYGKPGTDQIPSYVLWQAIEQMAVTDTMSIDVAVCFITLEATRYIILNEPPPISIYTVERDYVLEQHMINKATNLYNCIQEGRTPVAESLRDLKLLYQKAKPTVVQAPALIYQAWQDLAAVQAARKKAVEDEDQLKFIVQNFMGDAQELRYNNVPLVTWRNDQDSHQFDRELFEKENPELFMKYLVPKEGSRRFLVKEPKETK